MAALSRRTARADESEAQPGYRVWHITFEPMGQTEVTVTWKTVVANVIEEAELRDMMLLSETPEVFAAMVMDRAEEIVGEPMPAHVSNGFRREIVGWCRDNRVAICELLEVHNSA